MRIGGVVPLVGLAVHDKDAGAVSFILEGKWDVQQTVMESFRLRLEPVVPAADDGATHVLSGTYLMAAPDHSVQHDVEIRVQQQPLHMGYWLDRTVMQRAAQQGRPAMQRALSGKE